MRFARIIKGAVVLAGVAVLTVSACGDKKAPPAVAFPDSLQDDELIVTVNSQPVTGRDLKVFTLVYQPESRDSLSNRAFNVQLLRGYIDRALLWQEARATGIVIDDSTQSWFVNAFVTSMGGAARVEGFLATVGIKRAELEATIRRDLMVRSFVENRINAGAKVTDADARAYYDNNPERFVANEGGKIPYDEVKDQLLDGLYQRVVGAELENHLKRNRAVAIIEPNFDLGGLTQRESTTFTR